MADTDWWRGAVIYQVYPRSLMDANNDGIGDLQGIIQKLDYIASLNVDAIWISPFFKSPMKDFGYDISDYLSVDPIFGEQQDIEQLIEQAHERGIKVIIDQVLSHTSDQHAWFEQSREDKHNSRADWYVWADSKPDGTQPNNWLSIFGGPAWQWEPRRKQYYLHNFLSSQPDLNFHNPAVQQQALDNVRFWLEKGVDGFRLDAINFCFHDAQLRDNPAKPEEKRFGRGFSPDNPYAFQYHYYNNTQPEMLPFLERLRELTDQYPDIVMLGEISSEDSLATMAEYTEGRRLHMTYSFELLTEDYSAEYIRNTVNTLERRMADGWPCWAIGNHDVPRVVTRWGKGVLDQHMAKMLNSMLLCLRGSTCTYQGEELGLTEVDVLEHQLQDPYGITFWPRFKGRDGCRTPHPWQRAEQYAGFSEQPTWLPIPQEHKDLAVDVQEHDDASILNAYREMVSWRKNQPALRQGSIEFVDYEEPLLVFHREFDSQTLLVCFNLQAGSETLVYDKPIEQLCLPPALQSLQGDVSDGVISLPPYGICIAQVRG